MFNAGRHLGGGGRLLSNLNDNSRASTPYSQGGPQGTQNSANNAQNGALNLNPETDPILFTTESGLDIKFGAATLSSGALSGYTYFTMGSYDTNNDGVKESINWVIIGRSSSGFPTTETNLAWHSLGNANSPVIVSWLNNTFDSLSPAGLALENDNILYDYIVGGSPFTLSSLEIINDDDLDPGEVLAISEYKIYSCKFGSSNNDYEESILKTEMISLFETKLGFTDIQKKVIVPKYLTNYHMGGTSYTSNAFLFPLASRGENFNYTTYLSGSAIDNYCWLRSGAASHNSAYLVGTGGYYSNPVDYSWGVKPVMVLKLT